MCPVVHMDLLLLCNFVMSCTGHLGNTGSLSCIDPPDADPFHSSVLESDIYYCSQWFPQWSLAHWEAIRCTVTGAHFLKLEFKFKCKACVTPLTMNRTCGFLEETASLCSCLRKCMLNTWGWITVVWLSVLSSKNSVPWRSAKPAQNLVAQALTAEYTITLWCTEYWWDVHWRVVNPWINTFYSFHQDYF